MKLVDSIVKSAKPRPKQYKLADGDGLHLVITPKGQKRWLFRYHFQAIEKSISLGVYPKVTLKEARLQKAKYREQLSQGINPSLQRKQEKHRQYFIHNNAFEKVARDWLQVWHVGKSVKHVQDVTRRLEIDAFPTLGKMPISEIKAQDLIAMGKRIEARGNTDLPKRVFNVCGQVLRFALIHGVIERNVSAEIKPSDFLKASTPKNQTRIHEDELPQLMQSIHNYQGNQITKKALLLMTYTFVRTSELIGALWEEIDFDNKLWQISAKRMKMKTPHIVPLSNQAIMVLKDLYAITSSSCYIFAGRTAQHHMSNNTLLYALYRMGYHGRMTGHGFRGLASTILHEQGYAHSHIELQLAHQERNKVSAAYNHALYIEPRRKMMQDWADFIYSKSQ